MDFSPPESLHELQGRMVTVQNHATKSKLSFNEYFNAVWAVKYQVAFHYGHSRWVKGGFAPPATVMELPKDVPVPPGAWNVILLDNADQAGALGYHTDSNGDTVPYAEVFVQESKADGVDFAEVLSHEVLEMLVDPFVEADKDVRKIINPIDDFYYIVEVGDPVQGCGYDVGNPEGRKCGVTVADFAEPAWWGSSFDVVGANGPYSFRNSVKAAFEIAPQGYMSRAPKDDPNNWEQIYGAQRSSRPAFASRLPRIHEI